MNTIIETIFNKAEIKTLLSSYGGFKEIETMKTLLNLKQISYTNSSVESLLQIFESEWLKLNDKFA
jgi:hypothetical protein